MFSPIHPGFGQEFYINVDLPSQLLVPLKQDEATIKWWKTQKEAAKVFEDPAHPQHTIQDAMTKFNAWIRRNKVVQLWSQGSNFDGVLLDVINDRLGYKTPWRFYNTRDTRTAYEVCDFDTKSVQRKGTYHNALDDAKHQVRCIFGSYRKLNQQKAAMTILQQEIYAWGQETFEGPSQLAIAKRGVKEMEELVESIEQGKSADEIVEECADVAFFLLQLAQANAGNLQAQIRRKFDINLNRKWEKLSDGTFQHVE